MLRPIFELQKRGEITYATFDVMQPEDKIIEQLEQLRRRNTDMLVMTHASNICGKLFPIEAVGKFCKAHGITFIVDAAQSAGIADIHVGRCEIGALCVPAHKGLYGPQGLGFVLFGNKQPVRTLIEGGNGINSLSSAMGLTLPESFEGGTMPTPLIAGLTESVNWLKKLGTDQINAHETALARRLRDKLMEIPGSRLYGPKRTGNRNYTVYQRSYPVKRTFFRTGRKKHLYEKRVSLRAACAQYSAHCGKRCAPHQLWLFQ